MCQRINHVILDRSEYIDKLIYSYQIWMIWFKFIRIVGEKSNNSCGFLNSWQFYVINKIQWFLAILIWSSKRINIIQLLYFSTYIYIYIYIGTNFIKGAKRNYFHSFFLVLFFKEDTKYHRGYKTCYFTHNPILETNMEIGFCC